MSKVNDMGYNLPGDEDEDQHIDDQYDENDDNDDMIQDGDEMIDMGDDDNEDDDENDENDLNNPNIRAQIGSAHNEPEIDENVQPMGQQYKLPPTGSQQPYQNNENAFQAKQI